eukprot:TRINITY_DN26538_c0_g1_i3.p1 TRINITY_DN26538_c0_g1~~TRINITY_DN26538_c0_g1_i3.p1  ORF type:complete len:270 (+),score=61.64 TRINITY_DN26538_c0_g1_i3:238-1047(+)
MAAEVAIVKEQMRVAINTICADQYQVWEWDWCPPAGYRGPPVATHFAVYPASATPKIDTNFDPTKGSTNPHQGCPECLAIFHQWEGSICKSSKFKQKFDTIQMLLREGQQHRPAPHTAQLPQPKDDDQMSTISTTSVDPPWWRGLLCCAGGIFRGSRPPPAADAPVPKPEFGGTEAVPPRIEVAQPPRREQTHHSAAKTATLDDILKDLELSSSLTRDASTQPKRNAKVKGASAREVDQILGDLDDDVWTTPEERRQKQREKQEAELEL